MIKTIFQCDICHVESPGRDLTRDFRSITDRKPGFIRYRYMTVQEATPAGWIAFGAYTGRTYCPKCWAEIGGKESHD